MESSPIRNEIRLVAKALIDYKATNTYDPEGVVFYPRLSSLVRCCVSISFFFLSWHLFTALSNIYNDSHCCRKKRRLNIL